LGCEPWLSEPLQSGVSLAHRCFAIAARRVRGEMPQRCADRIPDLAIGQHFHQIRRQFARRFLYAGAAVEGAHGFIEKSPYPSFTFIPHNASSSLSFSLVFQIGVGPSRRLLESR
jgi:hypothetical protein